MKILTANELLSGATVYLTEAGAWVSDIDRAHLFADDDATIDEWVEKAQKSGRLISIEQELVAVEDGQVIAHRLRERIRAEGPTAPRHAIQSLNEGDHVSI